MHYKLILLFLLTPGFILFINGKDLKKGNTYKRSFSSMGCHFEVVVVEKNEKLALMAIETAQSEISRIEKLISSWDEKSQTSQINKNAGVIPVHVDKELYELIYRSIRISKLTMGAFDITTAGLSYIWDFSKTMNSLPDQKEIKKAIKNVNYKNIILNKKKSTVFLKRKGMRIGFGAIGKGYAANRAKDLLLKMKINNGVVNASGDLVAWGKKENGKSWGINIVDPSNKKNIHSWLTITDTAVVTSGDYEKYFEINGKKYSHIIDPRTGYPATGLSSVTMICPNAELADALATSVFVMGKEKGIQLIDQLVGIECLVIDDNEKIYHSKNLDLNDMANKGKKFKKENLVLD